MLHDKYNLDTGNYIGLMTQRRVQIVELKKLSNVIITFFLLNMGLCWHSSFVISSDSPVLISSY